MMGKPRGIEWLEQQTGQRIDVPESKAPHERHLSVRLSDDLADALEDWAREERVSMSHLVRDLLIDSLRARSEVTDLDAKRLVDRLRADVAEVSRRLAG
jgi:hypothetical protein